MGIRTKGEHVNKAYKLLRISGLTTQPEPQEIESALETLENMMDELRSRNICSSYVFEDDPNPDTSSGVNPAYNQAVATNLAVWILDEFGKQIPPNLDRRASASMSNWSARTATVRQIQAPRRMPRGSGQTYRFTNWIRYYRPENYPPSDCDTFDLNVGETNFFTVSYADELIEGETIDSYTAEPTSGITILGTAFSDPQFTFQVRGDSCGYQRILLTVTTSTNRVLPKSVDFNVTDI